MKKFYFLAMGALILASCASDNTPESFTVSFLCEPVGTEMEPLADIYAIINESKTKVANAPNCAEINPDQYERLHIPANALAVTGGWWAGYGIYVYAQKVDKAVKIFQMTIDEGSEEVEGSFDAQLVATYQNGKFFFEERGELFYETIDLLTLHPVRVWAVLLFK